MLSGRGNLSHCVSPLIEESGVGWPLQRQVLPYICEVNTMKTTRLFSLAWDNSKCEGMAEDERLRKHRCEGVQFSNGLIALDSGVGFESLEEMRAHIEVAGQMTITFYDEQIQKAS